MIGKIDHIIRTSSPLTTNPDKNKNIFQVYIEEINVSIYFNILIGYVIPAEATVNKIRFV